MRRTLRIAGTVLAVAVGLVSPLLASTAPSPALADTVINGCTVVSNPTPTNFTNCPGANLSGASLSGLNLSYANLSGAIFVTCMNGPPPSAANCVSADLSNANLTSSNLSSTVLSANTTEGPVGIYGLASGSANLSGANLEGANLQTGAGWANFTDANLVQANMTNGDFGAAVFTNANLTSANLTGAVMSSMVEPFGVPVYATLTGANLTNTLLVPANQSVTATSQAGAPASWSAPPGIPGASPGSCTPASGSTFPLFSSTVTCKVLDNNGDVATGTFQVNVAPTTRYFTRVLLPSNGVDLSGTQYLDAGAADAPGVSKVAFELTGGTLTNRVIATATATLYGWLAAWNTTTVPNGTYNLVSVATDKTNNVDTSTALSVTVDNPPPSTFVALPANNASLKGAQYLDAGASAGVVQVSYEISGGPDDLVDQTISGSTPTYYGWIGGWNTASVPDGTYTLNSVASYSGGVSGTSAPISITVAN